MRQRGVDVLARAEPEVVAQHGWSLIARARQLDGLLFLSENWSNLVRQSHQQVVNGTLPTPWPLPCFGPAEAARFSRESLEIGTANAGFTMSCGLESIRLRAQELRSPGLPSLPLIGPEAFFDTPEPAQLADPTLRTAAQRIRAVGVQSLPVCACQAFSSDRE